MIVEIDEDGEITICYKEVCVTIYGEELKRSYESLKKRGRIT